MTQLPEVEVIRKELEKEIVGKRFKDITVKAASTVGRHRNRPDFVRALQGHKIEGISRRGRWVLLGLDGDATLVVGLGGHGHLTRETATEEPGRHTQMVATFTTGGSLHFVDPDRDGELFVVDRNELDQLEELKASGIDPLADTFTWPAFSHALKTRDTPLKPLLVDESFIVGLGDLYADEILWAAGLSGTRGSSTLSSQEVRRLYRAIQEVLYEAVKQGGTSVDAVADPDLDGFRGGEFGEHLKVYGRQGHPCARCRQPIQRAKIDRRMSFYCAQCQT
ncbi:MAG TPA: bifunctional DNA-formamidopyrimidine glycosylase/DNA-(apurinic or apyrimidinic site) lyase [Egibacteraceae bacterium]|nr:bifunctional DNA-formamidopyrimidine glycosylase/DNA-(apurinic or apyrimidinic site) lyase [Actinomycetota bacterium]HWB71835.1 bifunctional DNA-formamidopyrimidine glycosylase/DNA-(apurinic or apyrimidinic site) lyase [Egibacteraceae bacterium]